MVSSSNVVAEASVNVGKISDAAVGIRTGKMLVEYNGGMKGV